MRKLPFCCGEKEDVSLGSMSGECIHFCRSGNERIPGRLRGESEGLYTFKASHRAFLQSSRIRLCCSLTQLPGMKAFHLLTILSQGGSAVLCPVSVQVFMGSVSFCRSAYTTS